MNYKKLAELLINFRFKRPLATGTKQQRLLELADLMQAPDFWADNQHAQKFPRNIKLLKILRFWINLEKETTETLELVKPIKTNLRKQ